MSGFQTRYECPTIQELSDFVYTTPFYRGPSVAWRFVGREPVGDNYGVGRHTTRNLAQTSLQSNGLIQAVRRRPLGHVGPPRIRPTTLRVLILAAIFAVVAGSSLAQKSAAAPQIHAASIGHGITLHYVDEGTGVPVIFVHGSLSDGGYWADQIGPFAKHYRAIAYSRRYNHPNTNPARRGYSAVVDSEDLAAFIRTLHLGRVMVIGHSYGALAGLFLAARHPELVRALVLAEPPAVSLLADLHGDEGERGKEMFRDIQKRMVGPMRQAYQKGDCVEGIRSFLAYVFNDPHA